MPPPTGSWQDLCLRELRREGWSALRQRETRVLLRPLPLLLLPLALLKSHPPLLLLLLLLLILLLLAVPLQQQQQLLLLLVVLGRLA